MSGVSIYRLTNLAGMQRQEVCAIYDASFPPSERAEFADRADAVVRGEGWWFVAESEQGIVGFALVRPLSCPGIYLLEYMAVAGQARNQGIGSRLVQHTIEILSQGREAHGVLIEVEPDGSGSEHARRRIEFYARNGAQEVPAADGYCMPDLVDESKSVSMRLMWVPLAGEPISCSMLQACIVSIYTDVYKRQADDPLLLSVLASLPTE